MNQGRRRKILWSLLLLIPGIAGDMIIHSGLMSDGFLKRILARIDMVYLIVIGIIIINMLLMGFLEIYSKSEKSRYHPLKGMIQALQVVIISVGAIIIVSILINKSPTALLTGLGASAAVLMLIFKDSILGFVAGVLLSQNKMIQIGDWIQMPDGSANGTVEEITLNTVKIRNWDNTITTLPPYTLISSAFRNWRGMQESGGRRVDKMIHLDVTTIEVCTPETVDQIVRRIPLMSDFKSGQESVTNSQLYREYIVRYLRHHDCVTQNLDLIIAQREGGQFGIPIEVYFFLREKRWEQFEKIQSDIFDHFIAMAPEFGLRLYQLPS